ncbi:hypothetical protein P7C73_g6208, partial [Tremellales sp. Uapishka_1]
MSTSGPSLRVLISSDSAYPPTQVCHVNSPTPTPLKTAHFEGEISVWVKDFSGEGIAGDGHEYFAKGSGRESMTYGIVVRGRFLDETNANEVVFGNVFEKPIKDSLPWGTSVATKFMYLVDPTLELDIYADKPWALSPTLATMNYLSVSKEPVEYAPTVAEHSADLAGEGAKSEKEAVAARRRYLGKEENRKAVVLDKETYVGMEFCNGLLGMSSRHIHLGFLLGLCS